MTKKRYVGFKFETVDEKDPVFDAKGIETVRKDGCPAISSMLEITLK
jgi:DNA polymerase zeta